MSTRIGVGAFRGVSAVPLLVASTFDIFDAAGLDVSVELVQSSRELREGIRGGALHVAHAAPDNFVVWADSDALPILSWLGGTSGPLELTARADIPSVASLAGCAIAVDAKASGFVSILRAMLTLHHVEIDRVALVEVGGTDARWRALAQAEVDATMLTMPWLVEARAAGFRTLSDRDAVHPALQTSTGASLRTWLDTYPDIATIYYRCIVDALRFARDRPNHEAVDDAIAGWLHTTSAVAEVIRAALCAAERGWPADGAIDPAGFEAMCAVIRSNGHEMMAPAAHYFTQCISARESRRAH